MISVGAVPHVPVPAAVIEPEAAAAVHIDRKRRLFTFICRKIQIGISGIAYVLFGIATQAINIILIVLTFDLLKIVLHCGIGRVRL